MKELSVFDIDRTIYNGSIFLDFALHLIEKEKISPKFLSKIGFEFFTYQTGFESYDELVTDCLDAFYFETKDIDPKDLKKELKECLLKNHHKFYDFALEIPKLYPSYEVLIISLEPEYVVEEVAKFLQIKSFLGNQKLEINKFKILKESLYSENKINSCFGDSESDYELLKHATFKYAINPTTKLSKLISQKEVDIQVINPEEAYLYFKKDH